MKRLALVGLALILIATVASAASVTVFDDAARAADDKASTLLRFADEAVLIHADGKTYPGGRLIASGVDANRLALVRDHRAIGERTGYDVLYSRASFQLTVLDEPGALSTGPWLWVERVTADRTVLSAPPKTKATPDPRVEGLVDGLSQSAYDSYLDYLASDLPTRFSCAEEIYDARDLIAAHFAAMGYATQTPTFSQGCVRCERADGHNVVGVKTGRVRPDDWFVVLGHYDSISPDPCDLAPGANDNASGTAGVMEMARLFAGVDTEATLVFLAVAGEEQGMYGSTDWVKDLESAGDLDRVKGFINMDMIAYYASHYEMLIEGADNEAGQAEGLADLALFLTTYSGVDAATTTDYNSSDHVPFLDRGVPGALMIESDWSDYDYYHTTGDTVDKQDTAFAIDGLRGVAAALATWAGLLEASPPATLSALTATEADGPVNRVAWATTAEPLVKAYHVARSTSALGPFTRITASAIPAQGGPSSGSSYSITDEDVAAGDTVWYRLEALDGSGNPTNFGPLRVSIASDSDPGIGCSQTPARGGLAGVALALCAALAVLAWTRRFVSRNSRA